MQKLLFVLPLFCACTIFGFEVEDKKRFSLKVAPKEMSAGVSFGVSRDTQIAAKAALDEMLKEAKTKTSACKGGEYYVYPLSEYDPKTKKNKTRGYEGSAHFACSFTDVSVYDSFLSFLNSRIKNKDTERVSIQPISWEISREDSDMATEKLKYGALEYATKRSAELSRYTKSACDLKKISFGSSVQPYYGVAMKSAMSATEAPIPQSRDISLDTEMLFECKR
jgi:hypothetical protein